MDWIDIVPEGIRPVVVAVVATAVGIMGMNRVAAARGDRDLAAGSGPAAGAVLNQTMKELLQEMEATNAKLDQLIEIQKRTSAHAGRIEGAANLLLDRNPRK